jgi:hypothetical protein
LNTSLVEFYRWLQSHTRVLDRNLSEQRPADGSLPSEVIRRPGVKDSWRGRSGDEVALSPRETALRGIGRRSSIRLSYSTGSDVLLAALVSVNRQQVLIQLLRLFTTSTSGRCRYRCFGCIFVARHTARMVGRKTQAAQRKAGLLGEA